MTPGAIPTVGDVVREMERLAPPWLAEAWDNCGLQVGGYDWPAGRVWVALDPTVAVVETACADGAGLLVTHHPLIFKPLARIDAGTPVGRVIERALTAHMAVYSAHTSLDSAADGLNDLLARRLAITPRGPIEAPASGAPGCGLGRIGTLAAPMTLGALAAACRRRLGLATVRVAGHPDLTVDTAALCSGSGGGLVEAFLAGPAQAYISGDLRYHDACSVTAAGRGMIDIGHFGSERIMIADVAARLREALAGTGVTVTACDLERDPFTLVGG